MSEDTRTARAAARAWLAADRSMTRASKDLRAAAYAWKPFGLYEQRYANAERKMQAAGERLRALGVCLSCALGETPSGIEHKCYN